MEDDTNVPIGHVVFTGRGNTFLFTTGVLKDVEKTDEGVYNFTFIERGRPFSEEGTPLPETPIEIELSISCVDDDDERRIETYTRYRGLPFTYVHNEYKEMRKLPKGLNKKRMRWRNIIYSCSCRLDPAMYMETEHMD